MKMIVALALVVAACSVSSANAEDIVEGTDTFVVGTEQLGPLRWTRYAAADGDTPPFVTVDPEGGYLAHGMTAELVDWSSTVMHSLDGVTWRVLTGSDALAATDRIDIEWVTVPTISRPGRHGLVQKGNFGYFATGDTLEQEPGYWVSVDGREWEPLFMPPDTDSAYCCGGIGHGAAGDLIYYGLTGQEASVLWIGRLEP